MDLDQFKEIYSHKDINISQSVKDAYESISDGLYEARDEDVQKLILFLFNEEHYDLINRFFYEKEHDYGYMREILWNSFYKNIEDLGRSKLKDEKLDFMAWINGAFLVDYFFIVNESYGLPFGSMYYKNMLIKMIDYVNKTDLHPEYRNDCGYCSDDDPVSSSN